MQIGGIGRASFLESTGSTPAPRNLHFELPASRFGRLALVVLAIGVAIPAVSQGVVLGIEFLFVALLPVLLFVAAKEPFLRALWLLATLWSTAQLTSDFVHGTHMLSVPTFLGPIVALLVTGLYWLHRSFRLDVTAILFAVSIGWIALELLVRSEGQSGNLWKYSLATPVTVAVLSFAYQKQASPRQIWLVLTVLAAVSVVFDTRSQLGFFLISLMPLIFGGNAVSKRKRLNVLVLLAGCATAIYCIYPSVALGGLLGQRALQQQITYQSEGANFIFATRMEFPQLLYLVAHDPVLGIGSYGTLGSERAYGALSFLDQHVAPLTANDESYLLRSAEGSPGYNSHTAALSAALYAGVLALPFWIFLVFQVLRGLGKVGRRGTLAPALVVYLSSVTLWDTLFSPITNQSQVSLAMTLFLLLAAQRGLAANRQFDTQPN